jgi:hypothetical protein
VSEKVSGQVVAGAQMCQEKAKILGLPASYTRPRARGKVGVPLDRPPWGEVLQTDPVLGGKP